MYKLIIFGTVCLSLSGCADFINKFEPTQEELTEKFTNKCYTYGYKKEDPRITECIERESREYEKWRSESMNNMLKQMQQIEKDRIDRINSINENIDRIYRKY